MGKPRRVIELEPYRGAPGEILYQHGDVEASVCNWCRWQGTWINHTDHECAHPTRRFRMRYGHIPGRCRDWNRDGDCDGFQPSLFTRLLRRFWLRGPVFLPPKTED